MLICRLERKGVNNTVKQTCWLQSERCVVEDEINAVAISPAAGKGLKKNSMPGSQKIF